MLADASQASGDDRRLMALALRLARRAWGQTSPNPMVGAVVVRDGEIVGRGFHRRAGGPHAEIEAMRAAGNRIRNATLYVTLEPCSSHGRTSPCAEAIVSSGLRRVVVGCSDPDPRHRGRGLAMLAEAGVEVCLGVAEEQCRELNEAFFCWVREHRPFTLLKMAMTLDGRIATAAGQSRWITGAKARAEVQKWRRWSDAIMVGGETVRQDNPRLEVRDRPGWSPQPLPIVCSRRQDFSSDFHLWNDPGRVPEIISPASPEEWRRTMRGLGRRRITALLIEGGGELAAECLAAGVVDKVMFFVAPRILGGRNSRPVVGGCDPDALSEARQLSRVRVKRIGEDILITGYPQNVYRSD